jgi:hypothetical protein
MTFLWFRLWLMIGFVFIPAFALAETLKNFAHVLENWFDVWMNSWRDSSMKNIKKKAGLPCR